MNGLKDAITGIFKGGVSGIGTAAKEIIQEFHISPEDKIKLEQALIAEANRNREAELGLALKEIEAHLADTANARQRDIEANNSVNSSWLAKNITPLLAIGIVALTFTMWYIILFKDIPQNKEALVAGIVGSLTTICMGVVGYYFGSSAGSNAKQKHIERLTEAV